MEPRISAVINTFNEEKNLPYALRSVQTWVDEIIVVDMYSEDRTVEIARSFGANVCFHERMGYVEPARAFAISQATGNWIMLLDADELVPYPLSRELVEIAHGSADVDAVKISRVNFLLGAPLYDTGWGPHQDKHIRFFKRGTVNANAIIHDFLRPIPGSRILDLPYREGNAIIHFSYIDTADFIERLNRYTTIEAIQALERGEHASGPNALIRGGKEFVARYFRSRGFRDGWRGFYLSLFMAFYRIVTCGKLEELQKMGNAEAVENMYRIEAEKLLKNYEQKTWTTKRNESLRD